MNKTPVALLCVAALAGCAALAPAPDYAALLDAMLKSSFREQGIAKLDRLRQDRSNAECSAALGQALAPERAKAIEAENQATIKPPADGRYLGSWEAGERLAQNGRGMTWTDASAAPSANGGNCYNCHQISKKEISFGTIGPSLYQYGRLRGVADPAAPESRAVLEYTWGKLYNAKATNACSNMPRFGHAGLLNEAQLKDLMALLLDPKSAVNQ